ncbi:MAG: SLBB domain-containing protein, partial [Candidatus Acidiferrales bacterium]
MKSGEFKRFVTMGSPYKGLAGMAVLLGLVMLACPAAIAQNPQPTTVPPSDLARQNLERVAASAAQIETVLHSEPGLMVELKRWVAKDATDHGQLISDSDLTDQAIYDRLDRDVRFRSVATDLLQKFGYLLPQINPGSPEAKEQELLIQDRAKWLAQDEEEERTAARQQARQNLEQTQSCDQRLNPNCNLQRTVPAGQQPQFGVPGLPPNFSPNAPNVPGSPQRALPTVEQTELMQSGGQMPLEGEELPLGGSYGSLEALANTSGVAGPGTLVPSTMETGGIDGMQEQLSQGAVPGQTGMAGGSVSGSMNGGIPGTNLQESPFPTAEQPNLTNGLPGSVESNAPTYRTENYNRTREYDIRTGLSPSQTLVRQPDPYLDVPSLYDMYLQAMPQPPEPERFGAQVFENGTRDLQMIPMDLPVGPDYVVGPGDSLAINLWGGVSQRLMRVVDGEGRVSLPEAGPVLVSGKSLADVQQSVQQTLRSQFRDVSVDVSLARLRTIRVYVVGDVAHPGAYDISSLSTPLNALFAAGGPTSQGSLRIVEHNRGSQLVQSVDVYELLLNGVKADIQRLDNGDTVLVPPIGPEVTVEGMVRRPVIYELKNEKSLADVLALAGGLLPTATLRHIEVQRVVTHEKRTMLSLDISPDADATAISKQLDAFQIHDGDKIRIFPIAPYNQDTVYLEGHVLRPGRYSYHAGMRVTDLVSSYKDILPEPAAQYAEIIRLSAPDYRPVVESFDLADALSHPGSAPLLDPLDTVQVFGRYDFENPPTVSVWGDVRTPGTYSTSGQIHLSDAVHMAGGLAADAETQDAQVFRYLPNGEMTIFSVNLSEALAGDAAENIVLNSRDRVLVHRNPAEVDPATVYIKGEVARPGRYPLTANMKVADLIHAAGGLQQSADPKNADLTSYEWKGQTRIEGEHQEIALAAAFKGDPGENVSLKNGDVLTIRQLPGWDDLGATIELRGEVTHPGSYGIRPGERLSSVLERAGGFQPDAYPYGALLVRSEVQQLEDKSHTQLVERVREQQASLELASTRATDPDEKLADQAAYQQWQNTVDSLLNNPPLGRVTIQLSANTKDWANTPRDITVRAGDVLTVPKRPSFVMVQGQVYNPTAVAYRPGKSAKWYLSQAGGPTNLANKKAIFVVRANGSVIGGSRGSSWFSGGALSESLQPGDAVVVPEKALG